MMMMMNDDDDDDDDDNANALGVRVIYCSSSKKSKKSVSP